MSEFELPLQPLLQQASSRRVSGEELETLGKTAADAYSRGCAKDLSSAVVDTVKCAGLLPEQVRRVVEFANQHAFLTEFNKEGAATKFVVLDGGPAAFNRVLQDLNDGGGGTMFDDGLSDYRFAPGEKIGSALHMQKVASCADDSALAAAFSSTSPTEVSYADPLAEVRDLLDKLACAREDAASRVEGITQARNDCLDGLYSQVKQASLQYALPLGAVVQAWHMAGEVEPSLVKSAFAHIVPKLLDSGVLHTGDLHDSLEKTAGIGAALDHEHPIVTLFQEYQAHSVKLAHASAMCDELNDAYKRLAEFRRNVLIHYGDQL